MSIRIRSCKKRKNISKIA